MMDQLNWIKKLEKGDDDDTYNDGGDGHEIIVKNK